jgi:hypothetical protein
MKRDLQLRRGVICGRNVLLLYFQSLQHSTIFDVIFSLGILKVTSFLHVLSQHFAISYALGQSHKNCSAPLRNAQHSPTVLVLKTSVLYDYFPNSFAQL